MKSDERVVSERRIPQAEVDSGVTEFVEIPNRGHSLTIDHGWREVADNALAFVQRFIHAEVGV